MPQLAGRVTVGPNCGGPQREGQSCSVALSGAEVRLVDSDERTIASTITNADGLFVLSAPAGRFKLTVGKSKLPKCPVLTVELPARSKTPLQIECDSGMR